MARAIDLQDTLSKTQAIEQVFKVLQQGPELDQRQFALNLKRAMEEKKEQVEETQKEEKAKIKDEEREKPTQDRYERKEESGQSQEESQQQKASEILPSSDHRIDMTI
jgi:hypothetical protein